MIKSLIILVFVFFLFTCTDNKAYDEGRKIAITQYELSCTGGSVYSCKNSCDGKCGIDSTPTNSSKLDCVNVCVSDCNKNCNTILLFLFNTKD